jgi:hypothetical protein
LNQLQNIPYCRALFSRPIDVDRVGEVAASIAMNGLSVNSKRILNEEDIRFYT